MLKTFYRNYSQDKLQIDMSEDKQASVPTTGNPQASINPGRGNFKKPILHRDQFEEKLKVFHI